MDQEKRHIINSVTSGTLDCLLIKRLYDLLEPFSHSEDRTSYMWDLNTVDETTIQKIYTIIRETQETKHAAERDEPDHKEPDCNKEPAAVSVTPVEPDPVDDLCDVDKLCALADEAADDIDLYQDIEDDCCNDIGFYN